MGLSRGRVSRPMSRLVTGRRVKKSWFWGEDLPRRLSQRIEAPRDTARHDACTLHRILPGCEKDGDRRSALPQPGTMSFVQTGTRIVPKDGHRPNVHEKEGHRPNVHENDVGSGTRDSLLLCVPPGDGYAGRRERRGGDPRSHSADGWRIARLINNANR